MTGRKKTGSNLRVREEIDQPPNINPAVFSGGKMQRKKYSEDEYFAGILDGNRTILSQAITLAESSRPDHCCMIQEIIERCLPYSGKSVRIGITGVPGAGKSTFIEAFGLYICGSGRKTAVLAIDPSSGKTKGSILGDKTRMEMLSIHPNAFIRPSPAAGTPGGVARKTRESIILCEAAGFDTILVETVGVGQSETAVHSMVDFFLLLMLAGAGDELQGIKRGIIEMADAIAITKADGDNKMNADKASVLYRNALSLFPPQPSGWKPEVLTCSAIYKNGIKELWDVINEYVSFTRGNGYFEERRKQQSVIRMNDAIRDHLNNSFHNDGDVKKMLPHLEKQLYEGRITSYMAAMALIDKYTKK
ncbi:MAG TPA: methylmalonyl Co-A mutase-associated GTPase MeaB [Bacteroidales bacterium]|jgi:LAO/AO transport system kinase|nr:methylmalonyl Co-A mutase-associated GTPase MeaB [Bacteroidales bacterium]HOX75592.1 methylmalonyl Co-A mutase-associated GTPase MeaB [Bacteroidales bacterium]HPM86439.1 methylmalonyl Co-A mutase-associated GTPase MeaB [Bacteroidales bacterium]HQM68182.1 methylmalonyl Co-A mutase-associated GTPase MeaB [Bacteroidales bacterium]